MMDGGYQNENWRCEAGWKWLQENPVSQPLYWGDSAQWDNRPLAKVDFDYAIAILSPSLLAFMQEVYCLAQQNALPDSLAGVRVARYRAFGIKLKLYFWRDRALP